MFKKTLNLIDSFLNKTTMYRLVLYYLIFLLVAAVGLASVGILYYNPLGIVFSAAFILAVCWVTNIIFAKIFGAPSNIESVYITALILTLIIAPLHSMQDVTYFSLAFWASVWAMAAKYIFAVKKKHIFNPAAFGVALTALTLNQSANWWVGTLAMAPFVLVGGFLLIRKLIRTDLVLSFFAVALIIVLGTSVLNGVNVFFTAQKILLYSPILFFAFVMLTEPLTTPPNRILRISYGALVGFLFVPTIHIGSLYSTPELALLAGNIFSYLVSPKQKLILTLREKIKLSPDVYDFIFTSDQKKISFRPGQYMEWTLNHRSPDNRGRRRYFTLASSPTEKNIHLGVKFYPSSSSFKQSLSDLEPGDNIIASHLAGDFTLPKDPKKKLVLIAGGIGITPFRSMLKYLSDRQEKRDVVLLNINKSPQDIVYQDVFEESERRAGVRIINTLTDPDLTPADWTGQRGFITKTMLIKQIPDYRERTFYISGPHAMVMAAKEVLENSGIKKRQIKIDFFPGFA